MDIVRYYYYMKYSTYIASVELAMNHQQATQHEKKTRRYEPDEEKKNKNKMCEKKKKKKEKETRLMLDDERVMARLHALT